jgi:hypothetical protein
MRASVIAKWPVIPGGHSTFCGGAGVGPGTLAMHVMFCCIVTRHVSGNGSRGFGPSFADEHAATVRTTGAANVVRRRNADMPSS